MAGEQVYAVVVTFNPVLPVLARLLARLQPQVNKILIVDNDSGNRNALKELATATPELDLLELSQNFGIGYAHNVGIARVRELRGDYVLILDQDSIPAQDMVSQLLAVAKTLSASESTLGAVGARYVGTYAGNDSFFVQFGTIKFRRVFCKSDASAGRPRYIRADFLISSGTLFPMRTLDEVGDMDEGLFIDHVDTEWFLRANRRGYYSYGACDALMQHGLGDETIKIWLGNWRYVPRHKPFRYYYMFRNSILLYKRSYAPARWIWNDMLRLAFIFVVFGLFSADRIKHVKMMLRGAIDGVHGVTGASVVSAGSA